MPITTAQLKAAIEAKIAAATGSTSLEDLTLIKNNADTWLANNSGSTITGYASLETLIQSKQDALTGSSTLDDITLTSASAFPPTGNAAAGAGFKNKVTITSSSGWVIPAGVFRVRLILTGGGGGGGYTSQSTTGHAGGGAASTGFTDVDVMPGQVINFVIGAGGLGGVVGVRSGQPGGVTQASLGSAIIGFASGGLGGNDSGAGGSTTLATGDFILLGGAGGNGGSAGSATSSTQNGQPARPPYSQQSTYPPASFSGMTVSQGSSGLGFGTGGGGGGGSSFYGIGGNAGASSSSGQNAPASSYGAGGGGAGPAAGSSGSGANGVAEVLY